MDETTNMKKKMIKQALSKTKNNKTQSITKNTQSILTQNIPSFKLKKLQTTQSVSIPQKSVFPPKINKKAQLNQSIVSNILLDLSTSQSSTHSSQFQSQSRPQSNFTQKQSYRSSFSQLLYTNQTDDVKQMIRKLFQNRNFLKQIQQQINSNAIRYQIKQQLQEMKQKLLNNQIFVLSLETRIKDKKQKEKQQTVQKQVIKKLTHLISFAHNERECHAVETRIENFLQEKLKKIRRKEF